MVDSARQKGLPPDRRGIQLYARRMSPADDVRPVIHIEIGTDLVGGPHSYGRLRDLLQRGAIVLLAPSVEAARHVLSDLTTDGSPQSTDGSSNGSSQLDDLSIDFGARRVVARGRQLRLSASEFHILAVLVAEAGRAVSFLELSEAGEAGTGTVSNTDSLRSAVKRLRQKLAAAEVNVAVESVPGFGFRLVAPSTAQPRD